jgi:hypothetical protein
LRRLAQDRLRQTHERCRPTPRRAPAHGAEVSRSFPNGSPETLHVRPAVRQTPQKPRLSRVFTGKPSAGLEPATPSLPWQSGASSRCPAQSQSRCTRKERTLRSRRHRSAQLCILRYRVGTLMRHEQGSRP